MDNAEKREANTTIKNFKLEKRKTYSKNDLFHKVYTQVKKETNIWTAFFIVGRKIAPR